MNERILLLALCFLLFSSPIFGQKADPYQILAKRCSSCHRWTLEKEAVDTLKTTLAKRLQSRDGHVRPLLARDEIEIVERFAGINRPVAKPSVAKLPVVKPMKKNEIDEKQVFELLAATCGRCHGWARDAKVVQKLKKRLAPRVKMGHGTQSLPKEKRQLLEKYYLTLPSYER